MTLSRDFKVVWISFLQSCRKSKPGLWLICGLFLVVSAALLLPYDGAVSGMMQSWKPCGGQAVDRAFAQIGEFQNFCLGIPLILIALASWRNDHRLRRVAVGFFMACMVSGIAVQIVKPLVGRARPSQCLREHIGPIEVRGPTLRRGYNSYPSGHTATMVAGSTVIAVAFPRLVWPSILASLAMAWTRIHGNSHYPLDTLHGAVIGFLAAIACCRWNSNLRRLFKSASFPGMSPIIPGDPHLAKAVR